MSVAPIAPISIADTMAGVGSPAVVPQSAFGGFARAMLDGLHAADQKVAAADDLVRAFAVDDSIPLHQVTFALEQARLAVELMGQVRARVVEGYQELMRMQL